MRRGTEGFALLASLWFVAATSTIAAVSLIPGRTDRLFASNAAAGVQARQAARAGVVHALSDLQALFDSQPTEVLYERPEGLFSDSELRFLSSSFDSVGLGSIASYSVTVRDGHVRIPLKTATEEELARLFRAAGVTHRASLMAAASIADWQDADDLHRAHGAEWPDFYSYQAPPRLPRDRSVETLEELRFIRGIDHSVFERITPYLSVSEDAQVNVNAAPKPVLLALPGMTPEAAEIVAGRRRAGRALNNVDELQLALSAPARATLQNQIRAFRQRATFRNRAVEIESVGWVAGSPIRRRLVVTAIVSSGGLQVVRSREL